MSVTYVTTIWQGGNNTGIPVPDAVLDELGAGRRPKVVAEVEGYTLGIVIGGMGGDAMISFSAAHRKASGLAWGQEVTVTLTVDTSPTIIEVPVDLAEALAASADAQAHFVSLAPSYRKNFVTQIEAAKAPATRERRIASTIAKLEAGKNR